MKQQITALIDGNNFYAACEQSIDPSLTGKPLVVLSNNDGCIVARSAEARALGIAMGQPYFQIRHKLNQLGVAVRSSNYTLYGDISRRLMHILKDNCEELEVYSIDEAFAHVKSSSSLSLQAWARGLRAQVYNSLGIPIAIGLGLTKVQAKIANHLAKTRPENAGVFDLMATNNQDIWLDAIAIEDVWGIGRELSRWCRLKGIRTARELRDMHSEELRSKYGVIGIRLQHELRGLVCLPLIQKKQQKKEICISRSFKRPITSLKEFRQVIATYIVRAGEKLRQQEQQANSITVFTRTSPFLPSFYSQSATTRLPEPSNNTRVLLKSSLPLTEKIFQTHRPLVKAGVIMQKLQSTQYVQQDLLVNHDVKKQLRDERVINTVDKLNQRYGHGTIRWASCGLNPNWLMRRDSLSKFSTTCLENVPIAKA